MRVVSGTFGGRPLHAPKTTATRPMTDKVRGALFDSLGSVDGTTFLDAYAGSGAVGIEALSRGVAQVVFIESARQPLQAIQENLQRLELGWGYQVVATTVESWLARQTADSLKFDVIVADPPYAQIKLDVITKLGALLNPEGVLVVSHASKEPLPALDGLSIQDQKRYGDTAMTFYKAL